MPSQYTVQAATTPERVMSLPTTGTSLLTPPNDRIPLKRPSPSHRHPHSTSLSAMPIKNVTGVLIFKGADGCYNEEKPLPASVLGQSSVGDFFKRFSEESSIPAEEFTKLRFANVIHEGLKEDFVSRSDSEDSWERFKIQLGELIKKAKIDQAPNTKLYFKIWVSADKNYENSWERDLGGLGR